jgi:hypothetical protein
MTHVGERGQPKFGLESPMLVESELNDLINVGRRIFHENCEQQFCDEWRQRSFELLSELLGPDQEYTKLFLD